MKKILIRNKEDYEKIKSFIIKNKVRISGSGREQILIYPERTEYSMVVAYDSKKNIFFAGEYDMKFQITHWADSVDDLITLTFPK